MRYAKSFVIITMLICYATFCLPGYSTAQAQLPGPSQLVQLYGYSTNGIISDWSMILHDGTTQPYTIPSGKALVITKLDWGFLPNVTDSRALKIVFGKAPLYNLSFRWPWYGNDINGGNVFSSSIGFAISNINNLRIQVLEYTTGALVPGTMEVRILGYHSSLISSNNTIPNYLLLDNSNS
jgi:hypothetical protein